MAVADRPALEVRYKGLLTIAIMAATLLQILDTTIANVALPHMQAALGATQDSITWVLTSYIIASAIAIPVTGWLADRIGARRLFLISVTTFVVASMLCGIASSLEEMVLFRLIQGVSGAFIAPLAQSMMLDINKKSDHGKAMAIYGMGIMVGPILGPIIGGWLTENWNWRWVFYVNVPVGVLCLILLWFLLPDKRNQERGFDLRGFMFLAIGLIGLQLVLDRGEHVDWFSSAEIWVEAGIAFSGFWMFAVHLATSSNALFPIEMLRDRNVLTGTFFMLIVGLVALAVMALLPPMLQNLYGYPVLTTGEILSSRGMGVLLTMALVGRIIGFIDARLLVATGFCIISLSLWMMTHWSLEQDWHPIFISGFIQGLGMGLVFVPLNVISFATLDSRYRTDGAALINLSRNLGSSLGIAIMSALLAQNTQRSHADLAQHVTYQRLPIDPNLTRALGEAGDSVLALANAEVTRQASMIAFLDDFKLMMFACLAVIPLLLFIRAPKRGSGPPPEAMME